MRMGDHRSRRGSPEPERERAARRISWTTLFLKAYAMVSADCRPLRQAWAGWPWGHLIEMPHPVGMVAINRGLVSDPAAPFGGMKQSGIGRELGLQGLESYLEYKSIYASAAQLP